MKTLIYISGGLIGLFVLAIVVMVITLVDFSADKNLDNFIAAKMQALEAKGLAVAFIKDGEISWSKNYGYADVEAQKKVTDDTIFQIASVSKTVTGVAIMQLYEKGLIDLDVSINEYLPFEIVNPNFPEKKITVRMLMQHKSSLIDNFEAYRTTFTILRGEPNPDMTLEELMRTYYLVGGNLYDKEANFSKKHPGEQVDYSNIAFGLLGFIVEKVTGLPFNIYCSEHIFRPLDMASTGWFTTEINLDDLAVFYDGGARINPYAAASYPDGGLKTTVSDFSKFLIAMMNGGEYKGQRILMQSSMDEMMPGNLNDNLAWQTDVLGEFFINTKDRSIEGHSGGDPGVASIVSFNRENATGMIVFMNGAQSLISPSPFMLVKMINLRAPYKRLAKKAGLIN